MRILFATLILASLGVPPALATPAEPRPPPVEAVGPPPPVEAVEPPAAEEPAPDPEPSPPPTLVGRALVLDGATIVLLGAGPEGGDRTVRLFGVDAQEMDMPEGPHTRAALDELIGGDDVACDERDIDRFGRSVATCFVGNVDVGEALIRQGRALVDRVFMLGSDLEAAYNAAELSARRDQLGVWALPGAETTEPWPPIWVLLVQAIGPIIAAFVAFLLGAYVNHRWAVNRQIRQHRLNIDLQNRDDIAATIRQSNQPRGP